MAATLGLAVLAIAISREVRRLKLLLVTRAGLTAGERAPQIVGVDVRQGTTVDTSKFADRMLGLLFVSPACSVCRTVLRDVRVHSDLAIVAICRSNVGECQKLASEVAEGLPVIADADNHLSRRYGIKATPALALVRGGIFRGYRRPRSAADLLGIVTTQEDARQHTEATPPRDVRQQLSQSG